MAMPCAPRARRAHPSSRGVCFARRRSTRPPAPCGPARRGRERATPARRASSGRAARRRAASRSERVPDLVEEHRRRAMAAIAEVHGLTFGLGQIAVDALDGVVAHRARRRAHDDVPARQVRHARVVEGRGRARQRGDEADDPRRVVPGGGLSELGQRRAQVVVGRELPRANAVELETHAGKRLHHLVRIVEQLAEALRDVGDLRGEGPRHVGAHAMGLRRRRTLFGGRIGAEGRCFRLRHLTLHLLRLSPSRVVAGEASRRHRENERDPDHVRSIHRHPTLFAQRKPPSAKR